MFAVLRPATRLSDTVSLMISADCVLAQFEAASKSIDITPNLPDEKETKKGKWGAAAISELPRYCISVKLIRSQSPFGSPCRPL